MPAADMRAWLKKMRPKWSRSGNTSACRTRSKAGARRKLQGWKGALASTWEAVNCRPTEGAQLLAGQQCWQHPCGGLNKDVKQGCSPVWAGWRRRCQPCRCRAGGTALRSPAAARASAGRQVGRQVAQAGIVMLLSCACMRMHAYRQAGKQQGYTLGPHLDCDGVVSATLDGSIIGHNGHQPAVHAPDARHHAACWHLLLPYLGEVVRHKAAACTSTPSLTMHVRSPKDISWGCLQLAAAAAAAAHKVTCRNHTPCTVAPHPAAHRTVGSQPGGRAPGKVSPHLAVGQCARVAASCRGTCRARGEGGSATWGDMATHKGGGKGVACAQHTAR